MKHPATPLLIVAINKNPAKMAGFSQEPLSLTCGSSV
jgi:hypothetical protein